MSSFQTTDGNTWELRITPAAMRRVKAGCGVNLGKMVGGGLEHITELVGDPIDFVNALYMLVKPQADKIGITDEAFGELLVGDVFELATTAFVEALIDFFPSRQRRILRTLLTQAMKEQTQAMDEVEKTLTSTEFASSPQP